MEFSVHLQSRQTNVNINPPLAGNFNVTSTGVFFMSPEKRQALDVRDRRIKVRETQLTIRTRK